MAVLLGAIKSNKKYTIKPIIINNNINYEFSFIYKGKKVKGNVIYSFYKNSKGVSKSFQFEDVENFDWYYYNKVDNRFSKDKRTKEQKQIEKEIIEQIKSM